MKLNAHRFNRHIANLGQDIAWRRARSCACFTSSSASPSATCKICLGKGRVWSAPVDTVVAISREQPEAQQADLGLWMDGDVIATVPSTSPVWNAGLYDRVTLRDATEAFSTYYIRGHVSEKVLFEVVQVDSVFWRHPTTLLMVEGGIPTIGSNGIPAWTEKAPPNGTTYSISGTRRPEYFLQRQIPGSRGMHSGADLPKKIQLRRWDLFGR